MAEVSEIRLEITTVICSSSLKQAAITHRENTYFSKREKTLAFGTFLAKFICEKHSKWPLLPLSFSCSSLIFRVSISPKIRSHPLDWCSSTSFPKVAYKTKKCHGWPTIIIHVISAALLMFFRGISLISGCISR